MTIFEDCKHISKKIIHSLSYYLKKCGDTVDSFAAMSYLNGDLKPKRENSKHAVPTSSHRRKDFSL